MLRHRTAKTAKNQSVPSTRTTNCNKTKTRRQRRVTKKTTGLAPTVQQHRSVSTTLNKSIPNQTKPLTTPKLSATRFSAAQFASSNAPEQESDDLNAETTLTSSTTPFTWITSAQLVEKWEGSTNFRENLLRHHNPKHPNPLTNNEKETITKAILDQNDPRPSLYINSPDALRILHALLQLDTDRPIAMDLEFGNDRAFLQSLELMQVSTQYGLLAVIDVSALHGYMLPMIKFFNERELIMHGCGLDLEMLFNLRFQYDAPCKPKMVYDTQLMAGYVGVMPNQIGLAKLIKEFLGLHLPKGLSSSDWTTRPLTPTQIKYAFDDCRYLHHVYDMLIERITNAPLIHVPKQLVSETNGLNLKSIDSPRINLNTSSKNTRITPTNSNIGPIETHTYDRMGILTDSLNNFAISSRKVVTPDNAWLDIAASHDLDTFTPTQLETLKVLAKWRQISGYRRNQRPSLLAKDQTLLYLAEHRPNVDEMKKQLGSIPFVKSNAQIIRNLIEAVDTQQIKPVDSTTTINDSGGREDEEEVLKVKKIKRAKLSTGKEYRLFSVFTTILEQISQQLSVNSELLCQVNELKHFTVTLLKDLDLQKEANIKAEKDYHDQLAAYQQQNDSSKIPPTPPQLTKPVIDINNLPPHIESLQVCTGFKRQVVAEPLIAYLNGAALTLTFEDE